VSVRLRLRDYGESGVLVGVEGDDYETRWGTTQVLAAALRDAAPSWLVDLVATYDHLYVSFEPAQALHREVEAEIEQLYVGLGPAPGQAARALGGRTFEVPVLFGGEAGPDLEDVAAELDLTPDALVVRLTASPWRVRFVAAPVGTPFTDRPDWEAAIPRMGVPRVAVPPGSVALSGAQSIIYPVRSPGGWRLVGRTPLRLVATHHESAPDPASGRLVPYGAGDLLRYVAVDADRYAGLQAEPSGLTR
jgi:KipI family sensor histidine kinase inhibitor